MEAQKSLETILPFLEPLAPLISDPVVTEIIVNGNGSVFFQRDGRFHGYNVTLEEKYLRNAAKRIARAVGDDIGPRKPLLDAPLPDGSRVACAFPPCSVGGTNLVIRKFRPGWFSLPDLVCNGSISSLGAETLEDAVRDRKTILVSGSTDSGKSTLAKALIDLIAPDERLAIIEDTAELKIDHQNVTRFVSQKSQTDSAGNIIIPPVTIRDLVKATLRYRPDRIIIGEVRGGEAFDLLDALNTGHSGSISTIHANSVKQALSRIASLALRADVDIPLRALQADIGDLINIGVHVTRDRGTRRVAQIVRINGFDMETGQYRLENLPC